MHETPLFGYTECKPKGEFFYAYRQNRTDTDDYRNWGLIGIFKLDLVALLCGGQTGVISRIVYTLVGLAAAWCISLLFRQDDTTQQPKS
mgnify:CR=1 FL=1